MKKNIIRIISILILIVVIVFISSIVSFLINPDAKDIKVEGYVLGENEEPLENSTVVIFNSTYKAKDNEYTDYSSYLGHDTLITKTNKNGYYFKKIDRSAFITIRVYKQGFLISKSGGLNSSSNIKHDFILSKGISEETELYEEPKIVEKMQ